MSRRNRRVRHPHIRLDALEDRTVPSVSLVRDINTTAAVGFADPDDFCQVGATLYFTAATPQNGRELWKTDGTSGGTVLVTDIFAGRFDSDPLQLTNVSGVLYFTADDGGLTGRELWRSNGTSSGTFLVRDIRPGAENSYPGGFLNDGGILYFRANDGAHGTELWRSNGTSSGTFMVADIGLGISSSFPSLLTPHPVSAGFYFTATTFALGNELWFSNGTASGTALVEDISPGGGLGIPANLTPGFSGIYFAANDGANGVELWYSSSSLGATMVRDINPGAGSSSPSGFALGSTDMFFSANDGVTNIELWKSNATSASTTLVRNINTSVSSYPNYLTIVNGVLFFAANGSATTGHELWKSDGTSTGTLLVEDIHSGSDNSYPSQLANVGGTLYFAANNGGSGYELWKSDGTSAGTQLVLNINPGGDSIPQYMVNFSGTLYFTANNGTGKELWKSSGAASNTAIVRDLSPANADGFPRNAVNLGGTLHFFADSSANGNELWRSNGTSSGTTLVLDINPGTADGPSTTTPVRVGAGILFAANDGVNGSELWTSDGTSSGTRLVRDINPGAAGSGPRNLINVNGTLFFYAFDTTSGTALWKSDGSSAGTTLVRDIDLSENSSFIVFQPGTVANVNGTLFFVATDGLSGVELWKSNGTSTGTVLVRDINPGSGNSLPDKFTLFNDRLAFTANDGVNGTELWISDGTPTGTMIVADIYPGAISSSIGELTAVETPGSGPLLYFRVSTPDAGSELWTSDGTGPGTRLVRDIYPGAANSTPNGLTEFNGSVVFAADNGAAGSELWISDGTGPGTRLLKDINPINNFSFNNYPAEFYNVNGTLYFPATDGINGVELWRSDGTSSGTALFEQTVPGSGDGTPLDLIEVNGILYFAATGDTTGRELWRLDGGLPPRITSNGGGITAAIDVVENTLTVATVTAVDPNPGLLTYSIVGGPDAADFAIASLGGALVFTARPDFESPADSNADNVYQVTVRVSDGVLFDEQTITVTVLDRPHDQIVDYVDDDWVGLTDGTAIADADPFTSGNQPAIVGTTAYAKLEYAIDAVASGGTVTVLPGTYADTANLNTPFSLNTPFGTVTISAALGGSAGLRKTGFGALVLSASNPFTGGLVIERGTISIAADFALGGIGNEITVGSLGSLLISSSMVTNRSYALAGGRIFLNPSTILTLNNNAISGGFLVGSGTFRTASTGASNLFGLDFSTTIAVELQGSDALHNVTNNALLSAVAGKTISLNNFNNNASGRVTLNGAANADGFATIGQLTVNGTLNGAGATGLLFGGGSLTTISAPATVNLGSANATIVGGLVRNFGAFGAASPSIVVDYNGRLSGPGTFGSVVTQNGGVFAPGSSPGAATTHQLNLNGGGRLEFEVANASGTPGVVSGWDLVNVQPTIFSPTGLMNYTSTPADKYIIQLKSRLDDGLGNTPGNIANFNSALPYAWKFADGSNALTGSSGTFNAANFQIDTTGFSNTFTGGFGVELRDGGKNLYVVYTPVAGPIVTSFVVNNGDVQRSRLTAIQVNFASPVDAAMLQTVGAITLTRTTATSSGTVGTIVDTSSGLIVSPASGMVSSVTMTFSNINSAGVNFGSLADGRWRLAIPSASFQSGLNDPILRRLYGDADNNGTVDGTDLGGFGTAFGSSGTSPFDFNNDLTVDALDFGEFGNRFAVTL